MTTAPDNLVRILRSREELEPLEAAWAEATVHPHTHPEVFHRLCERDPRIIRPHVPVVLGPDGELRGMMVARLEDSKLVRAGRYLPLPQPMARMIIVPIDGIIGTDPVGAAPRLLEALLQSMDAGQADVLELPFLPIDSPIRQALLDSDQPRYRTATVAGRARWHIDIADSFDEQLRLLGRSSRGTLRNNLNRFHKQYEGRFEIREYGPESDLEEFLQLSEQLARTTYHRGLDVGFVDSERERAVHFGAAAAGSLWGQIMLIDDQPVAFIHGLPRNGILFGTSMASDRNASRLPLGTILLFEALRTLCDQGSYESWDFGLGDAEYKRRLCNRREELERRTIFARTPRARSLRMMAGTSAGLESAMKWALGKTGLELRLKTALRNRARGGAGED